MPAAGVALNKRGDYVGGRYYPGKVYGSKRRRLPAICSSRAMMMYVFRFDAISMTPSGVSNPRQAAGCLPDLANFDRYLETS